MSSATIDGFAACQPDLLLRLYLVKTFSYKGETLLGKVKKVAPKRPELVSYFLRPKGQTKMKHF